MYEPTQWNKGQEAETEFWEKFTTAHSHFSEAYWKRELENYRGHIQFKDFEGKRILEVGCGPKGMIHFVPGEKKVGLDPLIEEYRRLHILEDGNVEHMAGVGENLNFEHESFDMVICFNVLDHSQMPSEVVKEIHRVLKRGGRLIFHVHYIIPLMKPVRGSLQYLDKAHPQHLTLREIRECFQKAGFVEEFKYISVFHWQARNLIKHLVAKTVIRNYFAVFAK